MGAENLGRKTVFELGKSEWFANAERFKAFDKRIIDRPELFRNRKYRVLLLGIESAEEVYSWSLVLEHLRYFINGFNYQVTAVYEDMSAITKARKAIFNANPGVYDIPVKYKRHVLIGSGNTEGLFTFVKPIRNRILHKATRDLDLKYGKDEPYDLIVYNGVIDNNQVVYSLVENMTDLGILVLPENAAVDGTSFSLEELGKSFFVREGAEDRAKHILKKRSLLIIEDSPSARAVMKRRFEKGGFQVECAEDSDQATEILNKKRFDLITLDLHMPGTNPQEWLITQRKSGLKTPVVIISGASSTEAQKVLDTLGNGAQDYFNKEDLKSKPDEIIERFRAILTEVRKGAMKQMPVPTVKRSAHQKKRPDLILIGASTGGTQAVIEVLKNMPANCPPVLVVQHIAHNFAEAFFERVAKASDLIAAEPVHGVMLQNGHVYMSKGDYHIGVFLKDKGLALKVSDQEYSLSPHRPSVDFLFNSAVHLNVQIYAALLTGMGKDGAHGLMALQRKGAFTMAQNEESCVVFGMPKEAIMLGAAAKIGNPKELHDVIVEGINSKK